jgi:hypothetical protein
MITRRQFLQTGSLAALAAPAAFPELSSRRDDTAQTIGERLSIGFWKPEGEHAASGSVVTHRRRSERKAPLSHEVLIEGGRFRADVADAAGLDCGDAGFQETGARVLVHGLMLAKRGWIGSALESLALDVHFEGHPATSSEGIRCAAWQYRSAPARSFSAPVAMRVPLSPRGDLRFTLESRRTPRRFFGNPLAPLLGGGAGSNELVRQEARFTAGSQSGVAKLRPGVYFLAGLRPGSAPPCWSDFQFRSVPALGGARTLVRRGLLGLETPEFDHLVLTIGLAPTRSAIPAV